MVVCVCPRPGARVPDQGAGNAPSVVPPAPRLGWALRRVEEGPGRGVAGLGAPRAGCEAGGGAGRPESSPPLPLRPRPPAVGGALSAPSPGAGALFEPVFCSVSCLRKLFDKAPTLLTAVGSGHWGPSGRTPPSGSQGPGREREDVALGPGQTSWGEVCFFRFCQYISTSFIFC